MFVFTNFPNHVSLGQAKFPQAKDKGANGKEVKGNEWEKQEEIHSERGKARKQ